MCDDAENLAGAGTDVRRCADALGPRKNLHRRVPIGVGVTGTYFKGVHLLGVHLLGVHHIGGHLILMGGHLMGIPTLWRGIL
jgi:hypothetical protein